MLPKAIPRRIASIFIFSNGVKSRLQRWGQLPASGISWTYFSYSPNTESNTRHCIVSYSGVVILEKAGITWRGGENGRQRNNSATFPTHFLTQKSTPLSTTYMRDTPRAQLVSIYISKSCSLRRRSLRRRSSAQLAVSSVGINGRELMNNSIAPSDDQLLYDPTFLTMLLLLLYFVKLSRSAGLRWSGVGWSGIGKIGGVTRFMGTSLSRSPWLPSIHMKFLGRW